MGAVGVWALGIGIGDLLAPADGRGSRLVVAMLALPVVAILGAYGLGLGGIDAVSLVAVVAGTGAFWLWVGRIRRAWGPSLALTGLAGIVVGLLLAAGQWSAGTSPLKPLLRSSPFLTADPERMALVLGLAVLLVATGNRIVRMTLDQVERDLVRGEEKLRGGRVIGPLERLLIFGLGVSGQLLAAGLVVTAKSLLRYGEVRRESHSGDTRGPTRAELMSEYLLVGSLLSWTLAFAAVAIVLAALP